MNERQLNVFLTTVLLADKPQDISDYEIEQAFKQAQRIEKVVLSVMDSQYRG